MRKTDMYCCWLSRQRHRFVYMTASGCCVFELCQWAKWKHNVLRYQDDVVLSSDIAIGLQTGCIRTPLLGNTPNIPVFRCVPCTSALPSATINGYLDVKVFESWNCLEYSFILCPGESCRDLALLTVSICSDHYQLSCPSRFLSFLPPVWNEPSGAVCRVLFNYIKQPMLIPSSRRVPCLAQLHFKWDFSVTTPKTAHWFIRFFPPCLISPSHASFSSSPSVFDLVTSRCMMVCSTYLYLLILNKPTHRAGETSLKELICSTLMTHLDPKEKNFVTWAP